MSSVSQYFKGLFQGIGSLLTGMRVTWKELFTKKVTSQYPENRDTLVISDRFRSVLVMPHDENNEHKCTSCGICQMNCPNGTINIKSEMTQTEDGKKKKILGEYHYNLGMCTFCNLCVLTCPSDAIKFSNDFENAVFTRKAMDLRLNKEGSKLKEKAKPQPKPVVPEKPVERKAEETNTEKVKPVEVRKSEVVQDKETKKENIDDNISNIATEKSVETKPEKPKLVEIRASKAVQVKEIKKENTDDNTSSTDSENTTKE